MLGPVDRNAVLDRVIAVDPLQQQRRIGQRFEVGDLTIDMTALQARWSGKPLVLPPNEFRLLLFFAENPNQVMTREQLIAGLGKQEPAIDARTVDVCGSAAFAGRSRLPVQATRCARSALWATCSICPDVLALY
jgi:two-component system phosphate regulon response regulator PhoB